MNTKYSAVEEFIKEYKTATKTELRNRLKSLEAKGRRDSYTRAEIKAIKALLS